MALDTADPDVTEIGVSDEGHVEIQVRVVRTCASCGDELKEANLEMEHDIPEEMLGVHRSEGHLLDIDFDAETVENTSGSKSRPRTSIGASVTFTVTCSCDAKDENGKPVPVLLGDGKKNPARWSYTETVEDTVAASAMDELV